MPYSYEEVVYDVLKKLQENLSHCKPVLWLDIINIDFRLEASKKKDAAFTNLRTAFSSCHFYYLSSYRALDRYWTWLEVAMPKQAIETDILDQNHCPYPHTSREQFITLFKKYFDDFDSSKMPPNRKESIQPFIDELFSFHEYKKRAFSLPNAKIMNDGDRLVKGEDIRARFHATADLEATVNLIVFIATCRRGAQHGMLAREIFNGNFSFSGGLAQALKAAAVTPATTASSAPLNANASPQPAPANTDPEKDLSAYFIDMGYIAKYLEDHNLTDKTSYDVLNYLSENKLNPNITFYQDSALEKVAFETHTSMYQKPKICLTYSWGEKLYPILDRLRKDLQDRKPLIWLDVFSVNQFDKDKKNYGLTNIQPAYSSCHFYYVSSFAALERYWCCFELSISKVAIENILLDQSNSPYSHESREFFLALFKKYFDDFDSQKMPPNRREYIQPFIDELTASPHYTKAFSLKNAKISFESDRMFINEQIRKKFQQIEDYQTMVNILIFVSACRTGAQHGMLVKEINNRHYLSLPSSQK